MGPDAIESKLAAATRDLSQARSALATIVDLSGLAGDHAEALKACAAEKLAGLAGKEGDFYFVRSQLRRALARGDLTSEEAAEALASWGEASRTLKLAAARVLRALPVFKQEYVADQTAPMRRPKDETPRLLADIDAIPSPLHIALDSTNRCNFRCITCPQGSDQTFTPFDLAWIDAGRFADALMNAETVHIAGSGEPLLSPTCWRILDAAVSGGAAVSITTNGSLLNRVNIPDHLADKLVIGLSFDGGTPETVQAVRRGFDWERVIANVSDLPAETRKRTVLAMTVVRQNARELPKLAAIAFDLGIPCINLQQFSAWSPRHAEMRMSLEDWNALQADKREVTLTFPTLTINDFTFPPTQEPERQLDLSASLEHIKGMRPETFPPQAMSDLIEALESALTPELALTFETADAPGTIERGANEIVVPHCTAPWSFAFINSEGGIYPCCSSLPFVGSVRDSDFASVWNSPSYVELRKAMLGEGDKPPKCNNCRDSSRFTRLVEMVRAAKLARPDANLRVLFNEDELPEYLRDAWREVN